MNWTLVHQASGDALGFDDVQTEGPFASWRHEHRFLDEDEGRSMLEDRLRYRLPFGPVGALCDGAVERRLAEVFAFRHRRTQHDLSLLADPRWSAPLRVAVTGSSGLVGSALVALLQSGGHEVLTLVRRPPKHVGEIAWNPAAGTIDAAKLEGVDAVVHLAGASIAGGRWTKARKRAIRESRIAGTTLLANALASLNRPPGVFVSTSAVGYYGDAGTSPLTEASPRGTGFLADVCREWGPRRSRRRGRVFASYIRALASSSREAAACFRSWREYFVWAWAGRWATAGNI
jgi:hypothetical protein